MDTLRHYFSVHRLKAPSAWSQPVSTLAATILDTAALVSVRPLGTGRRRSTVTVREAEAVRIVPHTHEAFEDLYILQRELASGGSGTVWSATHQPTATAVAIKVMRTPDSDTSSAFWNHREIEILKTVHWRLSPHLTQKRADWVCPALVPVLQLRHPNIVRVFDSFDVPGEVRIVMELVQGRDAFEVMHARVRQWGALRCCIGSSAKLII